MSYTEKRICKLEKDVKDLKYSANKLISANRKMIKMCDCLLSMILEKANK